MIFTFLSVNDTACIFKKEEGQDPLYYMYVTVFVRNAAYIHVLDTVANKGLKNQKRV
jgi:hypothetical protein